MKKCLSYTILALFLCALSGCIPCPQPQPPPTTPTITAHPVSATYTAGATATALSVTADAGSNPGTLSYQWFRNDSEIDGATSRTFTPPTATVGTFLYHCVVINNLDGVASEPVSSQTATITVNPATPATPTITAHPVSATYTVSDTATALSVTASTGGNPGTLSYQWFRDGSAIGGATSRTFTPSTATAGTFLYYCVVRNNLNGVSSEPVSSQTATITVTPTVFANDLFGIINQYRVENGVAPVLWDNSLYLAAVTDTNTNSGWDRFEGPAIDALAQAAGWIGTGVVLFRDFAHSGANNTAETVWNCVFSTYMHRDGVLPASFTHVGIYLHPANGRAAIFFGTAPPTPLDSPVFDPSPSPPTPVPVPEPEPVFDPALEGGWLWLINDTAVAECEITRIEGQYAVTVVALDAIERVVTNVRYSSGTLTFNCSENGGAVRRQYSLNWCAAEESYEGRVNGADHVWEKL